MFSLPAKRMNHNENESVTNTHTNTTTTLLTGGDHRKTSLKVYYNTKTQKL